MKVVSTVTPKKVRSYSKFFHRNSEMKIDSTSIKLIVKESVISKKKFHRCAQLSLRIPFFANQKVYPIVLECLQRDLEACLTFYSFPKHHWKTFRNNNVMERLFEELQSRSQTISSAFRTEESCLLLSLPSFSVPSVIN